MASRPIASPIDAMRRLLGSLSKRVDVLERRPSLAAALHLTADLTGATSGSGALVAGAVTIPAESVDRAVDVDVLLEVTQSVATDAFIVIVRINAVNLKRTTMSTGSTSARSLTMNTTVTIDAADGVVDLDVVVIRAGGGAGTATLTADSTRSVLDVTVQQRRT